MPHQGQTGCDQSVAKLDEMAGIKSRNIQEVDWLGVAFNKCRPTVAVAWADWAKHAAAAITTTEARVQIEADEMPA